jgi:hypothetical protein
MRTFAALNDLEHHSVSQREKAGIMALGFSLFHKKLPTAPLRHVSEPLAGIE